MGELLCGGGSVYTYYPYYSSCVLTGEGQTCLSFKSRIPRKRRHVKRKRKKKVLGVTIKLIDAHIIKIVISYVCFSNLRNST